MLTNHLLLEYVQLNFHYPTRLHVIMLYRNINFAFNILMSVLYKRTGSSQLILFNIIGIIITTISSYRVSNIEFIKKFPLNRRSAGDFFRVLKRTERSLCVFLLPGPI